MTLPYALPAVLGTPPEVKARELDMVWQQIFTWASWAIVVVMAVIAYRMCMRDRTPLYLIAMLAVGIMAFGEPLYDVGFDLWFYDVENGNPGAMWSHFTAFEVVQPNWAISGYVILYANMILYAGRRIIQGTMTPKLLFAFWALEIATSCAFEIIAINANVYTYWGPHELRLFQYPLVVGVLEATQVVLFTVLACALYTRVKHWSQLFILFPVFGLSFFGINYGVGSPTLIALHLNEPERSPFIVGAASVISMLGAAAIVWGVTLFLNRVPATPVGAPSKNGVRQPERVAANV